MNKLERKARLKAMKRAAKEARRAKLAADADARRAAEASPAPAQAADSPAAPAVQPAPSAEPDAAPAAAAREARSTLEHARAQAKSALQDPDFGEAEARAMLLRAAQMLDEVITLTRETLREVTPERLREAFEIVNAKPAPAEGNPQKRPRRGYDPVVSLIKAGQAAASLLQRVIGRTHPDLGRARRAA